MNRPNFSAASLRAWFQHEIEEPVLDKAGGPARFKVILLLACVLGLDAADQATVGAVAVQLEQALHIGNVEIGLLVTVSTAIGAFATLPLGILVDRIHRVRLLIAAIITWSLAMIASGASDSYLMLLVTRIALGAIVATAAPAVASLVGDFFHPGERGRIYGFILTGELVGAAFGYLVSGVVGDVSTWRAAFWVLAAVGLTFAAALWRWLPEPKRGGQSRIWPSARKVPNAEEGAEKERPPKHVKTETDPVEEEISDAAIDPHPELVLHEDPARMSWWHAVRYVLSIRTNIILIIASALGYFYYTGLRTFGVVFMQGRFDLDQSTGTTLLVGIGLGSIAGVLIAGRIADGLIQRGHFTARIWVAGVCLLIAAGLFVPGLLTPSLMVAAPLLFIAAAGVGGANPPSDAARLDIMHSRLWGRAESVRAALRYAFEAIAPITFGYVSTLFGGSGAAFGRATQAQTGHGLAVTFLIMLLPLAAAGVILLFGVRTYPRDVATAIASEENAGASD
jgi:predicted MFS family arabinose efflux permease